MNLNLYEKHRLFKELKLQQAINKYRKIIYILSIFFMFSISLANAQNISLNEKNEKIEKVLTKIRSQTGLDFLGDLKLFQNAKLITINVQNQPVSNVLAELSKGQNFKLSISNKTIIVEPLPKDISMTMPDKLSVTQDVYLLRGTILDEDNKPVQGATIRVPDMAKLVAKSDENGLFTIGVKADSKIQVTMLGYLTQEFEVENKTSIAIHLVLEDNLIEDVVVTGYSKISKESFTGAATTITRKELEKFNNNNIFSVLQSIDPAFKVDEGVINGSNPNVIPEINIRGISSVGDYAVNAPLVIVDGFEISLAALYDLDVNRIETISILKDASSTILYGSRGGNGVIVIETRLPKEGKFTVTYDAKPSVTIVDLSDYSLMNASEKLAYESLAGLYTSKLNDATDRLMENEFLTNLYNQRLSDVQAGTDTYWLSQPVQSTISVAHSIRMEGGSDPVRYSIDGNYNNFLGAMKESGRERGGAGFNLLYRIPNKFTFRNYATYQYTKESNSPYGDFSTYTRLNPYEKIYDENGEIIASYNNYDGDYNFGATQFNPIYDAQFPYLNYTTTNYIANNIDIEWRILKNLLFNVKGVIGRTFVEQQYYSSPFLSIYAEETDPSYKGSLDEISGDSFNYSANASLNYTKSIKKHSISVLGVAEIINQNTNSTEHNYIGFVDDRFMNASQALQYNPSYIMPSVISSPIRLVSLAGSFTYAYDNKIYATTSYRLDGSSQFGNDNRYGQFYSFGLAYNLHKEEWFKNNIVSNLKIFANTGINGSDSFSADMTTTGYTFINNYVYLNQYAAVYSSQGNESLRWPQIKQNSGGIELGLFNNAINIKANIYDKLTTDMISTISVAPSFGFANNMFYQNLGKVSNKGFEISSSFQVYKNTENDILWLLNFSAIQNRSKLLEISDELKALNESMLSTDPDDPITAPSQYYQEGESLSNITAVRSLGIDPATGREVYLDINGNRTFTWNANDQVVVGNAEPNLFGTFGTTFNYKRFSAQLIFNYTVGGDIYNQTLMDKVENNDPYVNADIRVLEDRWQQPGDVAMFKSISDQTITQISSRFVQRENYLRFSTLNLNYEIPPKILSKFKLQRAKFNFSCNDIFRYSTVQMERGTSYPYARTYNFGLLIQY
ncbi:SusC/RagA family TonB-linked outer membrane protein [Sphingobacterium hungaricum]|uniref:TonB-dependent receptor plug domain-containing protein n=1 Tax=Sphingobacterium hungaricum TaxID=2082723 RepID=A0A928YQH5_9SPHI|nr:SusC/RagA family TonB-linked outer membrane protein [Sphingobacterium hungaricum]MBE8713969.1 hypothetical protein [Sphingobacterium hungaricum]